MKIMCPNFQQVLQYLHNCLAGLRLLHTNVRLLCQLLRLTNPMINLSWLFGKKSEEEIDGLQSHRYNSQANFSSIEIF